MLVLGAHGFLGRHVARVFADEGARVMLAPPSRELDLTSAPPTVLDRLLDEADPQVLVNCAGRVGGSATELSAANHLLVARVLDAALRRPVPPRLLHLGSAAELGPVDASTVTEDQPAHPITPYGVSKLAATELLGGVFGRGELSGSVLRVFNPVGPGQSADSLPGRAARTLAAACRGGLEQVRFGPLDSYRDFIDARDVAHAAVCAAQAPTLPPLLNVARGMAVCSRVLVSELLELSGYRGRVEEDAPASSRSAAVAYQQADVSRLRALGWQPRYRLQQSLADLWAEHTGPAPLERSA